MKAAISMLRRLAQCRRGNVAIIVGLATVPLLGLTAFGTEAGMWYSILHQAQNAADAAAFSGALKRADALSINADPKTVDYRGKEYAAQNGFCNSGDTGYTHSTCVASNVQTVTITVGTYAGGVFTASASGSAVQAVVNETPSLYISNLFLTTAPVIQAQAVAMVKNVTPPCMLALQTTGVGISFQGSPTINAPGCGIATDSSASNALNFTGGGMSINVGSLSAVGGCSGTSSFCGSALTYASPVVNPYAALDTAVAGLTLPNCTGTTPVAYTTTTPCVNNNLTLTGNTTLTLTGTYFFSGTLTMKGTTALASGASGATFVLLPGASFSMKGTGTINISGPTTAPTQLPSSLLSPNCPTCANLFKTLAIYDASSTAVTLGGNSNLNFTGSLYFPNAAVTFQGNPTLTSVNCGQLIAATIAFNGNATFNNSGCAAAGAGVPTAQVVALVN